MREAVKALLIANEMIEALCDLHYNIVGTIRWGKQSDER